MVVVAGLVYINPYIDGTFECHDGGAKRAIGDQPTTGYGVVTATQLGAGGGVFLLARTTSRR